MYDTTDEKTLYDCKKWLDKLREHADPKVEIMLVGNKIDLTNLRSVATEEGRKFADANGI